MLFVLFVVELFALFYKLTVSQSIYEGVASFAYFKESFNVSSIPQLPELRCWDEWKEWNEGNKYNTHFGESNVSDISYAFFGETSILSPVEYYAITITSSMKTKYKSTLHVASACGLSEWCQSSIYPKLKWNVSLQQCGIYTSARAFERYHAISKYSTNRTAHYNEYCALNTSLDTIMYILYAKKGRINLVESKDDCMTSDNCIISSKSVIDLSDYEEGLYIIGIGGYGSESGKFQIELTCEQTSFPITNQEIDPSIATLGELSCGTSFHNQSWSNDETVVYYSFNVTHSTYFPFSITVCVYEDYSFDAYIIKLDELGLNYDVLIKMDHTSYKNRSDSSICLYHHEQYGMPAIITIDENIDDIYAGNLYWIMLQPFINHAMDFSIYMECNDPPTARPTYGPSAAPSKAPSYAPTKSPTAAPKIPEQLVMALVFGLCGLFMLLFIVYYLYKWRQFLNTKASSSRSISGILSPSYARSPKGEKLLQHDEDDEDDDDFVEASEKAIELTTTTALTRDDDDEVKSSKDANLSTTSFSGKLGSATSLVAIRSLHRNKSVGEQLQENEDVIQLILSDVIQSTRDQSGFDVYQVLALRYYDDVFSHNVIPRMPFRSIGINIELIELSPFVSTVFSAIVVGLTQTFGISMVVYKLFMGYFADGDIFDKICSMEQERWRDVFSLKVLAFLLSLVVTLFVGGLINGVRHDGLYEILSKLSLKHMERVPRIAICILQLGQAINYYVCFWAVIGSYFIIFVSNTGELQEDGSINYSGAGIEMILNAVALFFMLELDDMLVTDDDYSDCEQHLNNILLQYVPDTTINARYTQEAKKTNSDNKNKGRVETNVQQSTFSRWERYAVTIMYHAINLFSVFVTVCCYVSGLIAPFVIFFCW